MFSSYLRLALRDLVRNRLFTMINMIGLALGVGSCLLIGLYVQYELSYDRFHRDPENIFRLLIRRTAEGGSSLSATTQRSLSSAMASGFPEVESATQFQFRTVSFSYGEREHAANVLFGDSSFFRIFTFSSLNHNLSGALADPRGAVLTRSFARKVFAGDDPVGKTLRVNLGAGSAPASEVTVAAVMEDVPKNSLFDFAAVLPVGLRPASTEQTGTLSWNIFDMCTYVRVKGNADIQLLEEELPGFVQRTGGDSTRNGIALQRLTDIHLSPPLPFDDVPHTDVRDLYTFAGVGLLVLVIVCINYVVLATARYTQRLKEVGVRRAIGARFGNLMQQFLIETALIASLSMPLALGIVELAYHPFRELLGKPLPDDTLSNPALLLGCLGGMLFFTLAAGTYPAFFFSKVKAVAMLKGQQGGVRPSPLLRKGSVVIEFSIAIALLVCMGVMYEQLRYTRSIDLGYRHDNLIAVRVSSLRKDSRILKQAALAHSAVRAATLTSWLPGFLGASSSMPNPNGKGIFEAEFLDGDCDLLKTFQIPVLEGRDFDASSTGDTLDIFRNGAVDFGLLPKVSIILNQTAVKSLGLVTPVGKELNFAALQGTVIGVIRDVHNRSLHYPIKPMVVRYENYSSYLVIACRRGREMDVVRHLEMTWEKLTTDEYEWFSLDDHLRQLYQSDEKFMDITGWFAALAVTLSCLGLFGLAVYSTERRTKEIGIRKVLGASVSGIVALITRDFLNLVLLANVVAWPTAYFAMRNWLDDFAYRVDISLLIFVLAGAAVMVITMLTVSAQSMKVAAANPIESLRYE